MATRYNWMADTTPEAFAVWIDLHRKMTPGQRLVQMFQMVNTMMRGYEEGVRRDYPHANEREVFLRAAARRLGPEMVKKVYGWDPESGQAP